MESHTPEAVLITGVFGTGKTSLIQELAEVLEEVDAPYAAIDLDWLTWFHSPAISEEAWEEVLYVNLVAVLKSYREVGTKYVLLAGVTRDEAELTRLRTAISMPLTVVRLTLPLEKIRKRLSTAVTAAREEDLRDAARWLEEGIGSTLGDYTFANDHSIRELATEVMRALGWP